VIEHLLPQHKALALSFITAKKLKEINKNKNTPINIT
jgi:hypothetical protein